MIFFGSVIYKSAELYLDDFLASLMNQIYKDVFFIFIYEDYSYDEIKKLLMTYDYVGNRAILIKAKDNASIAENRIELMKNAKKISEKMAVAGNLLILGDCDDIFDINRIGKIVKEYEKDNNYFFYYNDLMLFDNKYYMKMMPEETNNINDIIEYNYLGLSNTSLNLDLVDCELIEKISIDPCEIFDWFLFSMIVIYGGKGKKIDETYTKYRIYENNIVGKVSLDKESLTKEINVKIRHYKRLSLECDLAKKLFCFYSNLQNDESNIKMYVQNSEFWWGLIRSNINEI